MVQKMNSEIRIVFRVDAIKLHFYASVEQREPTNYGKLLASFSNFVYFDCSFWLSPPPPPWWNSTQRSDGALWTVASWLFRRKKQRFVLQRKKKMNLFASLESVDWPIVRIVLISSFVCSSSCTESSSSLLWCVKRLLLFTNHAVEFLHLH